MSEAANALLSLAPVIPVISIEEIEVAVPLANALVAGGLKVLEITLRTPRGLEAIALIRKQVPEAIVGAGTITNRVELERAILADSHFVVTPGLTPELLVAGARCEIPFIPGVATASELMSCLDAGLNTLKFFPAESSGGAGALKAFAGPFPTVSFCPTGGISPSNLANYLSIPTVKTVGGTWLTPKALIIRRDWDAITQLAQQACELVESIRKNQQV